MTDFSKSRRSRMTERRFISLNIAVAFLAASAHCRAGLRSQVVPLPYLTYGEGVLPPSAEASSGPNAHPRINR